MFWDAVLVVHFGHWPKNKESGITFLVRVPIEVKENILLHSVLEEKASHFTKIEGKKEFNWFFHNKTFPQTNFHLDLFLDIILQYISGKK